MRPRSWPGMKTTLRFDARDTLLYFKNKKWNAFRRVPYLENVEIDQRTAYLFLLPALFFRFFPFIMTHNSTPMSAFLALVLIYIPAHVALAAWQSYSSLLRTMQRAREMRECSPVLMRNAPKQAYSPPSPWLRSSLARNPDTVSLSLWVCGALLTVWVYTSGISPPFPSASSLISSSPTLTAYLERNATYYISATFWNNEDILSAWTYETLQLIDILGPSNVYVSMTENDSEDDTPTMLRRFGRQLDVLNVRHNVNISTGIREEPLDDPWRSVRHRVGYMTNLRNGALQSLEDARQRFDVVILLNDVVFHHTDVLKLVSALGGDDQREKARNNHHKNTRRRMACGLDMDNAALYDAWVLQDRCGRPITGFWPFFTSEEDKQAVRDGHVLEVGTCWNGIAALDGDMLLDSRLRSKTADWHTDALRFSEPPECVISECALLPLRITNTTGGAPIVVDPTVVVAYSVRGWKYYAVWLRMPVVKLWMRIFEERYWDLWWNMGMGKGLRWTGLDNGREKKECIIDGWPRCDTNDTAVPGGFSFRFRGDL